MYLPQHRVLYKTVTCLKAYISFILDT